MRYRVILGPATAPPVRAGADGTLRSESVSPEPEVRLFCPDSRLSAGGATNTQLQPGEEFRKGVRSNSLALFGPRS